MGQTLGGYSTHPNKQLSSKNAWSEINSKGAGVVGNVANAKVKAPFLTRVIGRRRRWKVCKCQRGKKKNTYAKFLHDSDIKAAERCLQVSVAVVTYRKMVPYTNKEKAEMHFIYGAANGNGREAQRLYAKRFPDRRLPNRKTFERLHRQLCETGSFLACRSNAGRAKTNETLVSEEAILDVVATQPTTSTRAVARQVHVSQSTSWRVLRNERLHPYHVQRVQELTPRDYPRRVEFARWFLQQTAVNPDFGATVLFTDECTFTRDGAFNTHNAHVWADVNPRATYPHAHQRRFSINVWAGILGDHLIGPYLLPERLDGKTYLTFLQHVLPDMLNDVPPHIRRVMWFQHDGAPAHYEREVRNYLDITFPNRWIGRGGPVAWPARSPDLSCLDFFLWGQLKSVMYETPIDSPEELVARLSAATGELREMPGVFQNVRRCSACITCGGHCFEQLL